MSLKPDELKSKMKGVFALVMTPFDKNEELDEIGLRKGVRFLTDNLKNEDAVLVVAGSTGEFYAMNDEECKRVAEIAVEEANGTVPVLIGSGRAGTKYTIEMSKHAQEIGADGVMVVNPYYHLTTREALFRHISKVAESIDIGIMIYNNPVVSKQWIDVNLLQRISKIPNVVADKENTPSVSEYFWISRSIDPNDMVIVSGVGEMLFQFQALWDSAGYVTTLPNFAPQLAIDLARAGRSKDFAKVAQLMDSKIRPFYSFLSRVAESHGPVPSMLGPKLTIPDLPLYQSVTKEAMNLIGLPGGIVREPMDNITMEEKVELKSVLRKMGVF